MALAVVVMAAGFGQFGAVAALGDVAEHFGEPNRGATIADRAGLSGSVLGVGLAVIRVASLVSLPLAALADRVGRRSSLLAFSVLGPDWSPPRASAPPTGGSYDLRVQPAAFGALATELFPTRVRAAVAAGQWPRVWWARQSAFSCSDGSLLPETRGRE